MTTDSGTRLYSTILHIRQHYSKKNLFCVSTPLVLTIEHNWLLIIQTLIHRVESAFYVTHYIKWFDGERLTFAIDEVGENRVELVPIINKKSFINIMIRLTAQS